MPKQMRTVDPNNASCHAVAVTANEIALNLYEKFVVESDPHARLRGMRDACEVLALAQLLIVAQLHYDELDD